MRRARGSGLLAALALSCAPVDLRFGQGGDGGDAGPPDAGPPDAGSPDAGPCGGCAGLPLQCDIDAGACVECLTHADCATPRPACDRATGRCVECVTAQDCSGPMPGCDTQTHRCGKACTTLLDCLGLEGCGGSGLCRLCDDDPECANDPGGTKCDRRIGRCVECTGNADCTSPTARCDTTRGRCAACLQSPDCGDGGVCDPLTWRCAQ